MCLKEKGLMRLGRSIHELQSDRGKERRGEAGLHTHIQGVLGGGWWTVWAAEALRNGGKVCPGLSER